MRLAPPLVGTGRAAHVHCPYVSGLDMPPAEAMRTVRPIGFFRVQEEAFVETAYLTEGLGPQQRDRTDDVRRSALPATEPRRLQPDVAGVGKRPFHAGAPAGVIDLPRRNARDVALRVQSVYSARTQRDRYDASGLSSSTSASACNRCCRPRFTPAAKPWFVPASR